MTQSEIKSQFPDVYNAIVTEGVNTERSRVNAIMAFSNIDLETCVKMVSEGKPADQEFFAQMTVKGISQSKLADIKAESQTEVKTKKETIPKTQEEIEEEKYLNEVRAEAGLKVEEAV